MNATTTQQGILPLYWAVLPPPDAKTVLKVDLDVDTDRNGAVVDPADEIGKDRWTTNRGAFTIPSYIDAAQRYVVSNLPPLVVRAQSFFPPGHTLRLHRPSDSFDVKILNSTGTVVIGDTADTYSIPGPYPLTNDPVFYTAHQYGRSGPSVVSDFSCLLDLQELDALGTVVASNTVRVKVAPMILPWDGNTVEKVYATTDFPAGITNIPGLVRINPGTGWPWAQDMVKPCKVQYATSKIADVVIDLKHGHPGSFVANLCPATGSLRYVEWTVGGDGGNIMITPPLPDAPYGKAIVGTKRDLSVDCLIAQGVQTNVITNLPTEWLSVGHVDEVIMFANTNTVLVADPWTAANIMHAAITNGQGEDATVWFGTNILCAYTTPKFYSELCIDGWLLGTPKLTNLPPPGLTASTNDATLTFPTNIFAVGDYLRVDDEILKVEAIATNNVTVSRQWAQTTATNHYSGTVVYALSALLKWNLPIDISTNATTFIQQVTNNLTAALGGYAVKYVKLPVLFDKYSALGDFSAGSANVVNCLVHPGHGIFMQDTGSVEFNTYVSNAVPGVIWLRDTWDVYHINDGEIHCGTATRRTIDLSTPWWQRIGNWK